MIDPDSKVQDLLRRYGSLKRECPSEYLNKTYREIDALAARRDEKAMKGKTLVEQRDRLSKKNRGKPRR